MAWIALAVAVLALVVALSEKAWVRERLDTMGENWSRMREEFQRRGERREAERTASIADSLREAGLAAQLGEEDEARDHLADALRGLRRQADRLEDEAGERWSQLASDTAEAAVALETGLEAARTLDELAERVDELTGAASEDEEN